MVIELFHYSVPSRLGRRDKPELDPVGQAEADKRLHSSWVGWTPVKDQLIVHLKILRDAHAHPDRINRVQNALCCFRGHWFYSATVDCGIDRIQAVESNLPSKIAGVD